VTIPPRSRPLAASSARRRVRSRLLGCDVAEMSI
jgi:hypothetical protein